MVIKCLATFKGMPSTHFISGLPHVFTFHYCYIYLCYYYMASHLANSNSLLLIIANLTLYSFIWVPIALDDMYWVQGMVHIFINLPNNTLACSSNRKTNKNKNKK